MEKQFVRQLNALLPVILILILILILIALNKILDQE